MRWWCIMKITLNLDADVYRALKSLARERGERGAGRDLT